MLLERLRPFAFAALAVSLLASLPGAAQSTSPSSDSAATSSAGRQIAPVPNRLTQPIQEGVRVSLGQSVSPLAMAANDRGAAPEGMALERLQVVLKRSAAQETALQQRINDMHTAGTANYHKWLTPDEFGQEFGPSDGDIATLESWLQSHGFGNFKVNPGKLTLEMTGSVAQLRDTFHTQIRKYEVNGRMHYANATDVQIPAALAPVFGGFASLNNFPVHSHSHIMGTAAYDPSTGQAKPNWTIGSQSAGVNFVLSPGDYSVQYDLNPLYSAGTDGTGQTIAIINEANIDLNLVAAFRSLFNLPQNPPQVIIDGNDPGIDGNNNPDGPNGASGEAYLDVEWAGAVAPKATVDLVIGADTALSSGLFLALQHAIYGNIAPVVSISFGLCEVNLGTENQFISSLYEQAAAQGITVLVSTGDNGSAGCDSSNAQYAAFGQAVSGFASTPYNVAVGGTDFYYSSYAGTNAAINAQLQNYWSFTTNNAAPTVSILGVIPEQPWNDSQYGLILGGASTSGGTTIAAGSGGPSTAAVPVNNSTTVFGPYPKPSWQTGTGVPADKVRDIPDVSLFAANGANASYYPICSADGDCQSAGSGGSVQISGVGGTSASTPSFAGMMALVNQKYGRQGQADFVLYPLATQFPTVFHDVTNGTNTVPCNINTTSNGLAPTNCISAPGTAVSATDSNYGTATEGEIGTGTTPEYNATAGYDLATGLGTVDATAMVTNWGSVKFASSTVTLTPSSTSFAHGTAVTISGTVAGTTPTGSVALETDSTLPLQQGTAIFPLTAGAFSSSVNYLPGGTYNIFGQYSGDGVNAASTSTKTQITVTPESSSINFSLRSTAGNAVTAGATVPYGTQILLSALPVPTTYYTTCVAVTTPPSTCSSTTFGAATGSVVFADNGTTVNTTPLSVAAEASYNSAFSVGAHSVTASYAGDASYNSSTSTPIAFTVAKATPTILFTSTAAASATNSYTGGGATVFTVQVENQTNLPSETNTTRVYSPIAAPTGTVTVTSSPTGITASGSLQSSVDPNNDFLQGTTALTVPSSVAAGTYTVTIAYSGDANYAATSKTVTVTLLAPTSGLVASSVSLSASATATSSKAVVNVNAVVTGQSGKGAPTGTLDFSTSGINLGTLNLKNGTVALDVVTIQAGLDSSLLLQGANIVTVQYSGDTVYLPSATTITLTSGTLAPGVPFTLQGAAIAAVTAGSSATTPVTITPVGGFTGSVTLACTVVSGPPSVPAMPTCSIASPATITGAAPVMATLTVNTTARTAASLSNPFNLLFRVGGGIAVAGLLFFGLPTRRRSWRSLLGVLLFVSLAAGMMGMVGCGSGAGTNSGTTSPPAGGGGTTSNATGTTAGVYSVLVTGTSGSATETTSVTVTVN